MLCCVGGRGELVWGSVPAPGGGGNGVWTPQVRDIIKMRDTRNISKVRDTVNIINFKVRDTQNISKVRHTQNISTVWGTQSISKIRDTLNRNHTQLLDILKTCLQ